MKITFSGEAEDQSRDIQAAFREVSQELASRFFLRRSRYLMLYEISRGRVHVTKKQKQDY